MKKKLCRGVLVTSVLDEEEEEEAGVESVEINKILTNHAHQLDLRRAHGMKR